MTADDLRAAIPGAGEQPTVIMGVGNTLKADDGAGPVVCGRLASAGTRAKVIDAGTVPENYLRPVADHRPGSLVIVDAVDFGAPPGTVRLLDTGSIAAMSLSTHSLSLQFFADMVRSETGAAIVFIGIQPAGIALGGKMSPAVEKGIDALVSVLRDVFPAVPAGSDHSN